MVRRRWVRFDEQLRVRVELNQDAIRRTGQSLIDSIDQEVAADPTWARTLQPLRAYAQAGLDGQITTPRTWAEDPLRYEFGEFLLPKTVLEAYGRFGFQTHGYISGPLNVRHIDGVAYGEVDE